MSLSCSYSCEDNKLRLYSDSRLSADDYATVKAAGFKFAPKQQLFVAPGWTPAREDLLLELCGEIGDEDYSATERSADRAERFEGYRDKRADEAGTSADAFDAGPSTFGHQSRARAERQANRHDRKRGYAVSQWSKATYWQSRTAGVIQSALYKSSAPVRRSRILRLEAEQRKHEKGREEYAAKFRNWLEVLTLEGADYPGVYVSGNGSCGFDPASVTPALRLAHNLANFHCHGSDYVHPRTGEKRSLYSHLTDTVDPITPREAATLWLDGRDDPSDPESNAARWSDHYANRLTYERAMLDEEGGSAADAEMVPGGFIGQSQIHGVTKSPVTGKVTSVKMFARDRWNNSDNPPLKLQSFNIERLPEGAYRPPTAEELEAFTKGTKERKAEEKAKRPTAPPTINPTDDDAEKLQALWNRRALERFNEWKKRDGGYGELAPVAVRRMTQAEYSAKSKGSYGIAEIVDVCENGRMPSSYLASKPHSSPVAFKVRKTYGGGSGFTGQAYAVIVLTDKPQKAIPLDWDNVDSEAVAVRPSVEAESMVPA